MLLPNPMDCNSHPNITKPILMSMCFFFPGLCKALFVLRNCGIWWRRYSWSVFHQAVGWNGLKIAAYWYLMVLSGSMSIMMNHHETWPSQQPGRDVLVFCFDLQAGYSIQILFWRGFGNRWRATMPLKKNWIELLMHYWPRANGGGCFEGMAGLEVLRRRH